MHIPHPFSKMLLCIFCICYCHSAASQDSTAFPGIVIDHIPAAAQMYVGSPSICILPDGHYVASHDLFGPKSGETTQARTRIFESLDKGQNWHAIAEVNQFWSGLFTAGKDLYLMGVRNNEGDAVIRRSRDGGHTWTTPTDADNGLLLPASRDTGYHTAPVPVVWTKGKIWRAMEWVKPRESWGNFHAFVLSANEGQDLLKASSWTASPALQLDSSLHQGVGWLEGNAVIAPDGTIKDMLRVHYLHKGEEKAALLRIAADGHAAHFDSIIDFPGGCKKFTIRYDARTKRYWTLSNFVPAAYANDNQERVRNTLALCSSPDLLHWKVVHIVLQSRDVAKHGFQYADWVFDGKDIVAVIRAAYDDTEGGADNQHNANYLLFKRVVDFGQW